MDDQDDRTGYALGEGCPCGWCSFPMATGDKALWDGRTGEAYCSTACSGCDRSQAHFAAEGSGR